MYPPSPDPTIPAITHTLAATGGDISGAVIAIGVLFVLGTVLLIAARWRAAR